MAVTKELEALVIATLARMNDSQFRKALKASLDGRRNATKKKTSVPKKRKKLHWKTLEKIKRDKKLQAKKNKLKTPVAKSA